MRVRRTVLVECSACKMDYFKRVDTLQNWNGMCQKCSSRNVILTKIKGITRVKKPDCNQCGRMLRQKTKSGKCLKCSIPLRSGHNHYKWKHDRSSLAKQQERNDSCYKEWRKSVYSRDGFKCRIDNAYCCGRIEAHHILGWVSYPELRYNINNGITLCHAHHPRTRAEEKRLAPEFQRIVSVSKVYFGIQKIKC